MKSLYKFYSYFGRMGSLEGVFVSKDTDIENLIGKNIYFGECLGKHSDVYLTIEDKHLTKLSDNTEVIKIFEESIGTVGYNPFDYLDESQDEDEYLEEDEDE